MNTEASVGSQDGVQQLARMMAQMMGQINELRTEQGQRLAEMENRLATERETYNTRIKELQESLASLRATPDGNTPRPSSPVSTPPHASPPPPAPPVPPSQAKKKPTLPDPAKFDGNRKEFPSWLLDMEYKLEIDGPAIGSDKDQFAYIFSRLEKGAKSTATTFARTGGHGGLFNPKAFLAYLTACYGDPNIQRSARGRLARLKQRDKESFAAFLPKFEKELADSGGSTWPDDVKIDHLERSLNDGLAELLYNQRGMPTDYLGFVRALQDLGANLDRRRYQASRSQQTRASSPDERPIKQPKDRHATGPTEDVMDWEPIKINRAIQRQNQELAGKRAKWAEEEEVQRRRKEGLCTRCGRKGCWSTKCPLLPPKRPKPQTRVKKSTPRLPAVEDLVDSEAETPDQTESEDGELKE
ncbi:hypothetical protein C8A03DRAFT_19813 [Achaetomium macrosporum]|uniref:Retrotransposon gag domain-containing protein n=1 Tax=Achaetomium macrosporum TaxID=79813 RepID=A0AAN7H356_9PEZI|nr:hypothetical protein C8A03DRAFT_19813 [Achaetomium macrosporum]